MALIESPPESAPPAAAPAAALASPSQSPNKRARAQDDDAPPEEDPPSKRLHKATLPKVIPKKPVKVVASAAALRARGKEFKPPRKN